MGVIHQAKTIQSLSFDISRKKGSDEHSCPLDCFCPGFADESKLL